MENEKSLNFSKTENAKASTTNEFHQSIRPKNVKLAYHFVISHAIYLLLFPILKGVTVHLSNLETKDLVILRDQIRLNPVSVMILIVLIVFLGTLYLMSRPTKIYLVDFAAYKPAPEFMCSLDRHLELSTQVGKFSEENLAFQKKLMERLGFGQKTYITEAFTQNPPNLCITEARKEAEMVLFGAVDQLLAKTGKNVKDIGILVVNCSLFCPTPSLSAMIVNHYKMREDILSYNLGGMGCSAGIIAIDLAKDLLKVHRNTNALVVSTENMATNWYLGNNRPMLMSNFLFRMGGAAVLLSNKHSDRRHSKYELIHAVRTHKGADDKSYRCVYQQEDENGYVGVALSKDLMGVAGDALKTNITTLGPLVLPVSEQLLFLVTLLAKKMFRKSKIKPYIPDFKLAFEHFCIHAGGRAVLDEMQKNLNLSEYHMEPSRMTLYRFGNTSSSSLWYELAYFEAKGRVKKGDRTWQIAFGAGFKCNSAVWRALKSIDPAREKMNPWMDEIDEFPVHVPQVTKINYGS